MASESEGNMRICTIEGIADRELVKRAAAEVFGDNSTWGARIAPAGQRYSVAVRVIAPDGQVASRNVDLRDLYPFGNLTPTGWIELFSEMKASVLVPERTCAAQGN